MTVRGALRRGREVHESLMLDTCTVTRPSGPPVFDPVTGGYTIPDPTPVYDGPCRLKPWGAGQDAQAGEQQVVLRRYHVALPADTPDVVAVGDVFTLTSSADGWAVGHSLVVVAVEFATARTARWLTVEDQDA